MFQVCLKCNTKNRSVALFCKFCGHEISNINKDNKEFDFSELIGLKDFKNEINEKLTFFKAMKNSGREFNKKQFHAILLGNTGTGKSKIGNVLAKLYFKYGIISKPLCKTINAVDFNNFAKDFATNLNNEKGGLVLFEDVHKLVPPGYVPGQITIMDKLYVEMERQIGDPIILLSSRPDGFNEYLEKNPEVKKRFNLIFNLPDFTDEEMFELASIQFKKRKFILEESASLKLRKHFRYINKNKTAEFGNGHDVEKIVEDIIEENFRNPEALCKQDIITESSITGKIDDMKSTDEIFEELSEFIGMTNVKEYIRNMIDRINVSKKDAESTGKSFLFGEHLIITGNPGTGKTTIARKLGEIFASIGLLTKGHVIEADRSKIVSEFKSGTAKKVQQICDDALGGVLFIDEAYTLKQDDSDTYGQEAIDTLLKRMEDDRGKFMVIAAGYEKEMQTFINANPGLRSRFKDENILNIKDYTPEELFQIFEMFIKKDKFEINDDAKIKLLNTIQDLFDKRDKNFGNGRDIRNLYEKCLSLRATRLRNSSSHDLILYVQDIPDIDIENNVITLDEALINLNNLIGLKSVKEEINKLIDYINIEKFRSDDGGKSTSLNIHFIFKGNPGTGKTTVARILADIFKALGVVSKGNLVETDRKDLVAEYVGQTAPKTNKKIEEAIGGVLFIDEAYTLVSGMGDKFGEEAINTLLKRMEDDRGKFIVIAAGYNQDMDRFLDSNPGLTSRFTKHITFDDYLPEEMFQIFLLLVKSKGLQIDMNIHLEIAEIFDKIYINRDKNFANGRTVRNLFEVVLQNQAMRIAEQYKNGKDISAEKYIIRIEDFNTNNK
jgi:SpoVK/Ycf46/Vps4 family AAA+-type ATPase